jgi:Ca2+-binding EF-hand superfamily protein
VFYALDTNADGCLTKKDITRALEKILGIKNDEKLVTRIFESIDFDGNQLITISEFITAAMDRQKFLSTDRLAITFSMFDKDASGEIELFELVKLFYKSGVSR